MGLLDSTSINGWTYQSPTLKYLEDAVEEFIQLTVSRPFRDRIRTIEKEVGGHRTSNELPDLTELRLTMDRMSIEFVDELLDVVEDLAPGALPAAVAEYTECKKREFREFVESSSVESHIQKEMSSIGFSEKTVDLFRQ